ncbi:dihydrofolate synthase/folylpolyglutamate synthase [Volucribacter psittacicida]|uniref:Dihydrofolate synthase/folylpolyglutamate synthase n=1 Tax=Volucribacter psittacicida TaxID=203482 RepID=A0A4R1G569_9PAST|nr:bifunctional tetrahydrofolate synthase/dihydrofolate synthase [Volucribacter psittacicida]TCK01590.1 dihydrofolate synthase/folylpolyglutamate synthase [Volucribacter psittacicida]
MQYSQLNANSPLNEWLCYLEQQHYKPIDLGLDRVASVAKQLDLLKPAPFVITVGGTNGKGTTCRLLEKLLSDIGLKVGVYSSPHLIRYNERVRIEQQELSDQQHSQSFAFIEQNRNQSLTYFEFSTLSALHLFKQAKLDVVILEVGLGGRLDATNIVDADIAVITSIDIDHTDFLGAEREQIGFEKAGIFRANKPVVIGEKDIPQSMLNYAQQLGCKLACRDQQWHFQQQGNTWYWQNQHTRLAHLPLCQIPLANAATALAVLSYLPYVIPDNVIYQALQNVQLTGRFQYLTAKQQQRLAQKFAQQDLPQIILDVAHNPHAARYLAEKLQAIKTQHRNSKIVAICGILQDKDSQGIFKPLLPVLDQWYCLSLQGTRGQSAQQLQKNLQSLAKVDSYCVETMTQALAMALKNSQAQDYLIIFGSFYTVAELLGLFE